MLVLVDKEKKPLFPVVDRKAGDKGVLVESAEGASYLIPYAALAEHEVDLQEFGDTEQLFSTTLEEDKTVRINNVPVFKAYKGAKDRPNVDTRYLDEMVTNFNQLRATGWLPKIHISHTSKKGAQELPVVGFVDNLHRDGDTLYCDFRYLDRGLYDFDLCKGRYPDRSIELDAKRKRLVSVALLGSSMPYFTLPQMRALRPSYDGANQVVAQFSCNSDNHLVVQYEDETMHRFARAAYSYLLAQPGVSSVEFTEQDVSTALMNYKGDDIDELFELMKNMTKTSMKKKKEKEINGSKAGAGTGYSLSRADLQEFACGWGTAVSGDTGLPGQMLASNASTGVDEKGRPSSALHHFNDDADDVTRFVASLPEESRTAAQGIFSRQTEQMRTFADALLGQEKTIQQLKEVNVAAARSARVEKYRAKLVEIRAKGAAGITEDTIPMHTEVLMNYGDDEEKIKRYLAHLETQIVSRGPSGDRNEGDRVRLRYSEPNDLVEFANEFKASPEIRADYRRLGYKDEDALRIFKISSQYAKMDSVVTNGHNGKE